MTMFPMAKSWLTMAAMKGSNSKDKAQYKRVLREFNRVIASMQPAGLPESFDEFIMRRIKEK